MLNEHSIKLSLELPKGDVSKKMSVFYNPIMISNRNISILLLNSISNVNMNIADPLAGSGIRSLRFLKELNKDKINRLYINDLKQDFEKKFKDTAKANEVNLNKVKIHQEDASLFLLNRVKDKKDNENFCGFFDYIEIDPFGSPNPFLSAAISRISRDGIIAVTATDTAALTGTYPKVTKRKYWANSLKNYMMHETGLRILIRKIQLIGIQFDKALIPILSYSKDHYLRIYFKNLKGKKKCDDLIKLHKFLLFCPKCLNFKTSEYNNEECECKNQFIATGPLWVGKLFDKKILKIMIKENKFEEENEFLKLLYEDAKIDQIGFYDIHEIARVLKINPPRREELLKKLKAVRTHFSSTGIKSKENIEIIKKKIIKEL